MKNMIFSFFLLLPCLGAKSQVATKDVTPVIISVRNEARDDSSAVMMVNIDLSYHDIDRIFFEDEEGSILYTKEITDLSGERSYFCRVGSLKCNTKFNWKVAVHSRSSGVIKKSPFSFDTAECSKKKRK